jgi:hypothetical protein
MGAKVTIKKENYDKCNLLIVNSNLQKYYCQICQLDLSLDQKVFKKFNFRKNTIYLIQKIKLKIFTLLINVDETLLLRINITPLSPTSRLKAKSK